MALPFEARYTNPLGHVGQGFTAPVGNVLGRNSCISRVPLPPRYVPVTTSAPGRSRCTATCQLCEYPMRNFGSTPNVFAIRGEALKPFASDSRLPGVLCTLRLLENGYCCAICVAIGR